MPCFMKKNFLIRAHEELNVAGAYVNENDAIYC